MSKKGTALFRSMVMITLAMMLIAGPGFQAASAQSVSVPLFATFTAGSNMVASSAEQHTGAGSWNSNHATVEWYFWPQEFGLGQKTIGDIASIQYYTKNGPINTTGVPEGVDFGLYIYTVGSTSIHPWYGERLTAEPMYAHNYSDPPDTWNQWTSSNLTWYPNTEDDYKDIPQGWAGAPTLTQLQAPDFKWSTYAPSTISTSVVNYGVMPILAFKFGTGSGWSQYFDGFLDTVQVTFKNGDQLSFDLENQPQTVYVDDSWSTMKPGQDPDGDGPAQVFGSDAFAKIADGVSAVASGGTVHVAAGAYDENVTLSKPVTLSGPNAGINPNGAATRGAEAMLSGAGEKFTLGSLVNGIRIDGFSFNGITSSPFGAIYDGYTCAGNNVVITNNIFDANATAAVNKSDACAGDTRSSGWQITDNKITNVGGTDNSGLYLNDLTSSTISGNVIDTTVYAGIQLNASTNTNINANTVRNVAAQGIQLAGASGSINIFGNTVHNAGKVLNAADKGGIRMYGTELTGPVNVYSNVITGSKNGVAVRSGEDIAGKAIRVYWNAIDTTNEVGIYNGGTGTLNAACNWWGAISGPNFAGNPGGLGSTITGAVGFGPWLISNADGDSAAAGLQMPATLAVTPTGDTSAAENDFRVLQNAVGCAVNNQVIDLSGTFDWTQPFAKAAYTASYTTTTYGDIRGVEIPAGVNGLTITSSAGNAHILGAGDLVDVDKIGDSVLIYSSFLFGEDAPGNANLTVEKLNIDNFESAITLGWNSEGTFPSATIRNNQVELAGDVGDAIDYQQNIAFYFWNGQNQSIRDNVVTFMANGTRTVGYYGPKNGASFGIQNGTTGGSAYNGLVISGNTFQVGDTSNGTEEVYGVWENGHNDENGTSLHLVNNQFLGRTGDLFDHAFLLSSQSDGLLISGNTLNGVDEVFTATNSQGHTAGDQYTFGGNTLINVGGADGIFLKNVTNDSTPVHVKINWNTSNTIDGETGIRGLNELSTNATHAARPNSAATDIAFVFGAPVPVNDVYVNDDWSTAARFTDPDGLGSGYSIALGYNAFDTIQAGLAGVADTGTVHVLAGTYPETGQIVISKNVTLTGENVDTTIVKPTGDTGTDGDARGWFLVQPGKTFNLSNFTLDGNGFKIMRAVQSSGSGTIANNKFANIVYPDYYGVGVAMYSGMSVRNNTFTNIGRIGIFAFGPSTSAVIENNVYTGKGTGDWLDYGIELGGGAHGAISGNLIKNNKGVASTDGSTSAGMLITTFYGDGTLGDITGNTLMNNTAGIAVGYDDPVTHKIDTSTVNAQFNRIVGNTNGITSTHSMVAANDNWWGCNEGPTGVDCDNVDANVTATTWLVLSAAADPTSLKAAGTSNITASLVKNFEGADTSARGNVPNDIPGIYSTPDGGSVTPTSAITTKGVFTPAVFTAPIKAGNYKVCLAVDKEVACANVTETNSAPVAVADPDYKTKLETELVVDAANGVLKNDTDANQDPLTAVLKTDVQHGTLKLNPDGSFTYTPAANWYGTDTFTYDANDGTDNSEPAVVTISVAAVNRAPVANGDTYTTDEDTVLVGNVLTNDTDADGNTLTAELVAGPAHGKLDLKADGSFTYTPDANFNGMDSFTYQANDGVAKSNTAEVAITVKAINDAPVAANDSYTTKMDTALTIAAPGLLSNDTDVEGATLTAVKVTGPSHGTLTLNADGSFTYTPEANWYGTDTFTYKANDGTGGTTADSNVATVTITVTDTHLYYYLPLTLCNK